MKLGGIYFSFPFPKLVNSDEARYDSLQQCHSANASCVIIPPPFTADRKKLIHVVYALLILFACTMTYLSSRTQILAFLAYFLIFSPFSSLKTAHPPYLEGPPYLYMSESTTWSRIGCTKLIFTLHCMYKETMCCLSRTHNAAP